MISRIIKLLIKLLSSLIYECAPKEIFHYIALRLRETWGSSNHAGNLQKLEGKKE